MAITKIQSESLNLADDFAFTGTITGAGGVNTPAFQVVPTSTQGISANTDTVIAFNSKNWDTNNYYNTGTYRFTPLIAGKYFFYVKIRFDTGADWEYNMVKIRKNGSDFARFNRRNDFYDGLILTKVLDANGTTDYFDFTVRQESAGGVQTLSGDGAECFAGGYKIIE